MSNVIDFKAYKKRKEEPTLEQLLEKYDIRELNKDK